MNLPTYLGNAVTRPFKRIFSGSRISTPLGKWDSPKSPQGYYRAVADLDFQISGRGGMAGLKCNFLQPFGPQFGLNIRGTPPLEPPLIRKENGFQEKDDRSSGYGFVVKKERECGLRTRTHLLADPELPLLFHFFNVWQTQAISHSPISTTTKTTKFIEIQHISNYIIFSPLNRL